MTPYEKESLRLIRQSSRITIILMMVGVLNIFSPTINLYLEHLVSVDNSKAEVKPKER